MPGQSTRHGLARGLPDLENQIEVSANSGLRQHAAFNAGQRTSGTAVELKFNYAAMSQEELLSEIASLNAQARALKPGQFIDH